MTFNLRWTGPSFPDTCFPFCKRDSVLWHCEARWPNRNCRLLQAICCAGTHRLHGGQQQPPGHVQSRLLPQLCPTALYCHHRIMEETAQIEEHFTFSNKILTVTKKTTWLTHCRKTTTYQVFTSYTLIPSYPLNEYPRPFTSSLYVPNFALTV